MIEFKPRLAAFYVFLIVVIALLSNRMTIQSPSAIVAPTATIGQPIH